MKRQDFLKLIGTGGGTLLFGGMAHPQMQLIYTPKKIKVYDNYVKGTQFYRRDFMKLAVSMDTPVHLKRDLENPYDQFAIKVMCHDKQIGYVAAFENIVMANLLDQGVVLTASISEIVKTNKPHNKHSYLMDVVAIQIFVELMVPASHIQLAELTKDRAANAMDIYRQGAHVIEEKITFNKKK
ncbi:HIRAN domain-containing protein [Algibacter sp. 2305UL17-15]|uniref:HIRAN domain-containing protein n=1 Tax=Algibacter sp. 2305UL17-15 TaxID=3231268 RepID=UPI003459A18B